MTTDSGDARSTPGEDTGATSGGTGSTESPYAIGIAPEDDAAQTGPEPLDTELEDQQVRGEG